MRRLAALSLLFVLAWPAAAQEVVAVPTRPEVTDSIFIADMGGVKPEAAALLYAGGSGDIRLRSEGGRAKFSPGNFLIRSRAEFVRNRIQPVLVDVPSDWRSGVTDVYRHSDAQTADARAVLAEVRKRFPGLPVFIVTTSRSTLTAAHLARVFAAGETAGIVLSSSMVAPGAWETIGSLDPATVKVPLLFVHHRDDGCAATPYAAAARLAGGYPLISVKGGDAPRSGPCDPFAAHGYLGKEAQTVDAIAAWMLKKPFPKEIE